MEATLGILHRMCAVLSNDCVAPTPDASTVRKRRQPEGRSICYRLLTSRAEPVSRFDKDIGWLTRRGQSVPALRALEDDEDGAAPNTADVRRNEKTGGLLQGSRQTYKKVRLAPSVSHWSERRASLHRNGIAMQ
jgi:hypothetical protein